MICFLSTCLRLKDAPSREDVVVRCCQTDFLNIAGQDASMNRQAKFNSFAGVLRPLGAFAQRVDGWSIE